MTSFRLTVRQWLLFNCRRYRFRLTALVDGAIDYFNLSTNDTWIWDDAQYALDIERVRRTEKMYA
jgi:hypothetical protein